MTSIGYKCKQTMLEIHLHENKLEKKKLKLHKEKGSMIEMGHQQVENIK